MRQRDNAPTIRQAKPDDLPFIRSLSPVLAGVIKVDWHSNTAIQSFQDGYIDAMMAAPDCPAATFIAEQGGVALGFIHVRERADEISGEPAATVPLLAVTERAQGTGAGRLLVEAAEDWAKARGHRLLHLEVFASNTHGQGFYRHLGFRDETINMIKPLSRP